MFSTVEKVVPLFVLIKQVDDRQIEMINVTLCDWLVNEIYICVFQGMTKLCVSVSGCVHVSMPRFKIIHSVSALHKADSFV